MSKFSMHPTEYKKYWKAEQDVKKRFANIRNAHAWVTERNDKPQMMVSVDLHNTGWDEIVITPAGKFLSMIKMVESFTISTDRVEVVGPCRMSIKNPARFDDKPYWELSGTEPGTGLVWWLKLPVPSDYVHDGKRKLESYTQDIYYPRSGRGTIEVPTKVWNAPCMKFSGGDYVLTHTDTMIELFDRLITGK